MRQPLAAKAYVCSVSFYFSASSLMTFRRYSDPDVRPDLLLANGMRLRRLPRAEAPPHFCEPGTGHVDEERLVVTKDISRRLGTTHGNH
jgi:hypothetical protein